MKKNMDGAAIAIIVALAVGALWFLPKIHARSRQSDSLFKREDDARKTLAQVLGGLAIVAGLYTTLGQLRVAQDGQVTDRFTKALGQLADEHLEVRIGAVFALERIAADSDSYYWPSMEVLTAYVRNHAPARAADRGDDAHAPGAPPHWPAADVQTVLAVLGRRSKSFKHGEEERMNLNDAHLCGANLTRAHLEGASMQGSILHNAILWKAQLDNAYFVDASLVDADLADASARSAVFTGADLRNANLRGTRLERSPTGGFPTTFGAVLATAPGSIKEAVIGLTAQQIRAACIDRETIMPAEVARTAREHDNCR
jgi:hypothetical protein